MLSFGCGQDYELRTNFGASRAATKKRETFAKFAPTLASLKIFPFLKLAGLQGIVLI